MSNDNLRGYLAVTILGYLPHDEGTTKAYAIADAILPILAAGWPSPEHERFIAQSIAQAIEDEAQRESDRVKWDGSPGLLGNWIGGIRVGAKLARNYATEDGTA